LTASKEAYDADAVSSVVICGMLLQIYQRQSKKKTPSNPGGVF
jgi:hypothetical protein